MSKGNTRFFIPKFILAHFSHHVCTGALIPLIPLLREGFGLNYFQSGILISSFSISYGIGSVPMAILADLFSRRLIIISGLIGVALTGIGVSFTQTFWQLVPCFIAMGLLGGTYHAPASSFISQTLPYEKRGRALGMHIIGGSTSFLLTPVMALGIATLFHSWRASFLILSLPPLLTSAILWLTTEETRHDFKGQHKESKTPETGLHETSPDAGSSETQISWSRIISAIGVIACLAIAMQIVFESVSSYLPLFMVDHHNISPKWAGIVISFIGGAGIIGAPLGGALSDRFGRKQVILFSLALSGPLFLAVTRSPFGIPLLMALLFYGLAMTLRTPIMESHIADVVPVGRRTTVLGVYFFMGTETAGVATPIVGRLIDMYGLDPVFTGLAVGLCLVALIALLFRKHI